MGPARTSTARFALGFVVVLALLPALVWGIRTVSEDRSEPTSADKPAAAAEPRPHELGCSVLTAPESLSERSAACETEPPAYSPPEPQHKPRAEKRRAKVDPAAKAEPESCDKACPAGTIEAEMVGDAADPVEATDEPQDVRDVVGTILAPAREKLPTEPLAKVEEPLEAVEETLEEARTVIPDEVKSLPEIEIQLDPPTMEPLPRPLPELESAPTPELPAPLPLPTPEIAPPIELPPSAVVVLDEETAEELGVPERMTIALSKAARRALAIVSERAGLELSVVAPGSSESSRD